MNLTDDDEDVQYSQYATPPPEDIVVDTVMSGEIAGVIRSLREPYLQVSVLYLLEQKPVEEIAKQLGRPPKTVHTQLYRAKQLLQKQLTPKGGFS